MSPRRTESETGRQDQETVFLTSAPGHSDARDHRTTLCRKRCLIAYGENEHTHVLSWIRHDERISGSLKLYLLNSIKYVLKDPLVAFES